MADSTLSGKLTELSASFSYVQTAVVQNATSPTRFLPANPRRYAFLVWFDELEPDPGISPGSVPNGFYMKPQNGQNWFYFNARDYPGLVGLDWWAEHNIASTMYVVEIYPLD